MVSSYLIAPSVATYWDITLTDVPIWDVDGAVACWDLVVETSGPLAPLLAGLPTQTRQAIRDDAMRTFDALFPGGARA